MNCSHHLIATRSSSSLLASLWIVGVLLATSGLAQTLPTEELSGTTWVSPIPKRVANNPQWSVRVWFDKQLLGDGEAYLRRAKELQGIPRRELRTRSVATLKQLSQRSFADAKPELERLIEKQLIRDVHPHWIVNGFRCNVTQEGLEALKGVTGVKKIFVTSLPTRPLISRGKLAPEPLDSDRKTFDPDRYQHPWYINALNAKRTWSELGITGKGTLNVVHDFNFSYPDSLRANLAPCVGYNFNANSKSLRVQPNSSSNQALHGSMCAAIICGTGTNQSPYEFGIAPEARWAGVIARGMIEDSIEWAVEQQADTYSMSFSQPGLMEFRSHWRKIMEHGSLCGVFFVSGAGNFAQTVKQPLQMRTPEDIPHVVFAAAGVKRDLSRTPFSSQGPVEWETEHYRDGIVAKPEVCAFNFGLPKLLPDGKVLPRAINGNSFAGPMFCGSIALMLSADPDLLPWELREIIMETATDIGPPGVDDQTGHGLINCYRAVKEVLRRKAIREGQDPAAFAPQPSDKFDPAAYLRQLQKSPEVFQ